MSNNIVFIDNVLGRLLGYRYYDFKLSRKLGNNKEPILIWQMGKVGSKAVVESIENSDLASPVFHVHVLSESLLMDGELYARSIKNKNQSYLSNVCLKERLIKENSDLHWKIITLVREPVARNVSAFFQNIDLYLDKNTLDAMSNIDINELQKIFLSKFDHAKTAIWFDEELKSLLGIDVYSYSEYVPGESMRITKDNHDVLILRMEDLEAVGMSRVEEFIGAKLKASRANIAKNKYYGDVYSKFKNELTLPVGYVTEMYNTKFSRHFYSGCEIEKFISKWTD